MSRVGGVSDSVLFWVATGEVRHYDSSPDGQRFLMIKEAGEIEETSARDELIIVLNWFEDLKRLVPTD